MVEEKQTSGKHILVVDQSRTIQILLRTYFGNAGHLVIILSTSQEALHALTVIQDIPDIIFLAVDYEQHTHDLREYLKSHAKYARTKLVAMVLKEEKGSIQRTWGKDVHYLVKPFHIQEAVALVSAPVPGGASSEHTR